MFMNLTAGAASTTSGYDDEGITKELPESSSITTNSNWAEYTTITNYKGLKIRPFISTWSSTQRIGRIYLDVDESSDGTNYHAFLRGGDWFNTSIAGVFALRLYYGPSVTSYYIGFRCAR